MYFQAKKSSKKNHSNHFKSQKFHRSSHRTIIVQQKKNHQTQQAMGESYRLLISSLPMLSSLFLSISLSGGEKSERIFFRQNAVKSRSVIGTEIFHRK
jgi:hypothetical protein